MLVTHSGIMFSGNEAWGDKDLFRLAFALSGNPDSYHQVSQSASVQPVAHGFTRRFMVCTEVPSACAGLGSRRVHTIPGFSNQRRHRAAMLTE